jgi:hypothetical protein
MITHIIHDIPSNYIAHFKKVFEWRDLSDDGLLKPIPIIDNRMDYCDITQSYNSIDEAYEALLKYEKVNNKRYEFVLIEIISRV